MLNLRTVTITKWSRIAIMVHSTTTHWSCQHGECTKFFRGWRHEPLKLCHCMLFLLLSTLFLFAVQSSDVISATDKTFHKLLESKLPVLVKFYAPWYYIVVADFLFTYSLARCGHCKSLAPTWEKVATSLKGLANIVKVDCTVEQSLCGKYSIQGYPTLKLFKNKGKKVQDYQQARDLAAIVRFTQGEIDDKSLKIKNDGDLTKFLEKDAALPHVILFSEKAAPAPLFKALSCSFDGTFWLEWVFVVLDLS